MALQEVTPQPTLYSGNDGENDVRPEPAGAPMEPLRKSVGDPLAHLVVAKEDGIRILLQQVGKLGEMQAQVGNAQTIVPQKITEMSEQDNLCEAATKITFTTVGGSGSGAINIKETSQVQNEMTFNDQLKNTRTVRQSI